MRVSDLLAPDADWDEKDLPLGNQEPTHRLVPECFDSHGPEAIEFARYCGYELHPFQAQGLIDDLGYVRVTTADGRIVERWAAQETEEVLSRRNGKTIRFVVLILFALFMLGEEKILYTAHRDDTAKDVFDEFVKALERTPRLWAQVVDSGPRYTNGQRSVELKTGQIVYFRTRGTDAGRGQGYNRLIFDEDQNLTEDEMAAMMPLATGAENAQINFGGSAGGRTAKVQAKIRRSADNKERGLCYRGWHANVDDDLDDLDLVARLNPRLGYGLSYTFIAKELARMSRVQFGRERCGAATYPRGEGEGWVIPQEAWLTATDTTSATAPDSPLAFVLESGPQLDRGTIAVAGFRTDGAVHIEVTDNAPGVLWMVDRAKQLQVRHGGAVGVDPKGPLGYLVEPLRDAGVNITLFEPVDLRDCATWFYTELTPRPDPKDPDAPTPPPGIRHRGAARMTQALAAAETRRFLDRWTLRRQVALEVDQGPIVGVMLAGWLLVKKARQTPPPAPRKVAKGEGPRRGYRKAPQRRRSDADLTTTGF
ncbi:hypothetical protein [Janibacter sp. GS2]|uniref:hypothetical protein n=1 Tax=Janibacter sp. GS2 TaxID=3442646 RepID=UPI003EB7BF0C